MTNKRFRFTTRQLLVLTVAIAGVSGLLVSFAPHFLWASKHVLVQGFPAMTKVDNGSAVADCELSTCTLNGLSFDVPTSMIGTARIVRSPPTDVWLAFEDSTMLLHIPLAPIDVRAAMAEVPSELKNLSTPELLEIAVSAASDDFSFSMSKAELRIHRWAMETRQLLNLDNQPMDHFSRFTQDKIDAILISADPTSIDSHRRIRSILDWESTDRQSFGSIWFGDSRKEEIGWIDAVARGLTFDSEDRLETTDYSALSDAEILSRLKISEPNER